MKDTACVDFLQWALPQLDKRWRGFRKVRRQVCKRIDRRREALGLSDVNAYRTYLESHLEEWAILDSFCRISISRFYRDRGVFDCLRAEVLPALAQTARGRGEAALRIWSIGCASGEEPYSLSLLWQLELQDRFPEVDCTIVATDADSRLLDRSRRGCYPDSSLKDLPPDWRARAFVATGELNCLRNEFKTGVEFRQQDIRTEYPADTFQLILCRNLVFTYFELQSQLQLLARICEQLRPEGVLIIGKTEQLPEGTRALRPWLPKLGVFLKSG